MECIKYFIYAFLSVVYNQHFDGLVQDCSNSSALAMELLQSCTEPSFFLLCPNVVCDYKWIPGLINQCSYASSKFDSASLGHLIVAKTIGIQNITYEMIPLSKYSIFNVCISSCHIHWYQIYVWNLDRLFSFFHTTQCIFSYKALFTLIRVPENSHW